MVLPWSGEGAMLSASSCPSYPSNVVSLGLCGEKGLVLPHSQVLGFSQCYPVYE